MNWNSRRNRKMIKRIEIVSLSSGVLGEAFVQHELEIGLRRLQSYGAEVSFSSHALCGLDYLQQHPEARAADLLEALQGNADMILCAIGGDDTYRLLPYLWEEDALLRAAEKGKDKIFLGFSDSTMNHLMLHKVGMRTFYGQSFLSDVCEIGREMLPYTRHYLEELLASGTVSRVRPAEFWYDSREDFSPAAVGTSMPSHPNEGFLLWQGSPRFSGEILGGCIDTLFDIFNGERYPDSPELCSRYELFPSPDDWNGKILLLESSEEKATPEKYRRMIRTLKATGIFERISGLLIGKPDGECYFADYRQILLEEVGRADLPIVANLNIGHASPRCILPFGVPAFVDAEKQEIVFGA